MSSIRQSRGFRAVLWLAGATTVLAAVLAGVLLAPPVQRALVRRALVSSGATEVRLEGFHATPFGLAAERIGFSRGPLRVEAQGLEIDVSPRGFLRRRLEVRRISVGSLHVSWDVDAASRQPVASGVSGTGQPEAAFQGLLGSLRLPVPVSLGDVEIPAVVVLVRGKEPVAEVHCDLGGGGLIPGGEGRFTFGITAHGPALGAAGTVFMQGTLSVSESVSGTVSGLSAETAVSLPQYKAMPLPVRLGVVVSPEAGGESYKAHAVISVDSAPKDSRLEPLRGTRLTLDLARSMAPDGKGPGPVAILSIEHVPVALSIPSLSAAGITLDPSEASGAWDVRMKDDEVDFVSRDPLVLAPLRIKGPGLSGIGTFRLKASPGFAVSKTSARIQVPGISLESANGHGIDASAAAFVNWGEAPFVEVNAFSATVRGPAASRPLGSLNLLQPLRIDLRDPAEALSGAPKGDLVRITARDLPLAWISRWLPGRTLEGRVSQGESVLSNAPDMGLSLVTTTPWRAIGLRFTQLGRVLFQGNAQVSPAARYGPKEQWVRLADLSAEDVRGYRLAGRLGFAMRSSDERKSGGIFIEADLPHLPFTGIQSGPLKMGISAVAHTFPGGKASLSHFSVTLGGAGGESLVSISAATPVSIRRTDGAEWLFSSPEPLRFLAGRIPLAKLNPLLASKGISINGLIPATELQLRLSERRFVLESKAPLAVAKFHLEKGGSILVDRALLRVGLSADLGLEHRLLPAFQMNGGLTIALKDGLIAAEGSRIARFDGRLRGSFDERGGVLRDVSGSLWVDLGALGRMKVFSHAPLPPKGELTVSLKKSTAAAHTVVLEARLDHLVGRDGVVRPPLIVAGRAKCDLERRIAGFGLQATLLAEPRPSDLHFGLRMDYGKLSVLDLSSKLEGSYVDVDAVRNFGAAFSPVVRAATPPAAPPAPAAGPAPGPKQGSAVVKTLLARAGAPAHAEGGPPWGLFRGHFVLAIQTIVLKPYTVLDLGGRLDATEDSLALTRLSGRTLDGKWSADLSVRHAGGDPGGAEVFRGHFDLVKFDAGKAARMRFKNPAAGVDGRLDLDVTVASQADDWQGLVSRATGTFSLVGHGGRVRLALPQEESISSALILGGTLTFSSELRALGRLIPRLTQMPFDRLEATGTLASDGRLELKQLLVEAPDLRLVAVGSIANAKSRDLAGQPLAAQATLFARSDLGIILAGMHLLGRAGADGYRAMNQPFLVGGNVGQPDLHPLYDLLAKAVDGSSGSWGLLMREVRAKVAKAPSKGS